MERKHPAHAPRSSCSSAGAGSRTELERAPWRGATGPVSTYRAPGAVADFRGPQRWLQYQATLTSLDGCHTPSLREVAVEFA